MNRYFFHLAYEGTAFHGWQVQDNAVTVQGELNKALKTILQQELNVVGCGRTDTGVHARDFFAHMDVADLRMSTDDLMFKLNCLLPRTIGIHRIWQVHSDAHARFSATARTYEYHIHTAKDPFSEHRAWYYHPKLDLGRMNQAASTLLHYSDFTTFSKSRTQTKTNNCVVARAQWEKNGHQLVFTIQADRFLRNMVRAIVGTLILVGQNRMDTDRFEAIIQAKDRKLAGPSAPAEGLYLTKVDYPAGLLKAVKEA